MMPFTNLGATDRMALRNVLEKRRQRLKEDLRLRVARIRDQGTDAAHTQTADDDATDLDVTLVEIANETLRVIDAAIERLDRGQYGHCVRCQGRISESRLRAMPFAVRCHECQSIREREAARAQSHPRRAWERDGGAAAGNASP